MTNVFAEHVDAPDQRHRLVLLDSRRLRCLDCTHTLVLPTGATSTSQKLPPSKDQACPTHPGGWAGSCAGCRADTLVSEDLW